MNVLASWLERGYFDFSDQDPRKTTSHQVREELCKGLGLEAGSLRIASYPVGPAWRHTFWWREGGEDYSEAQFFIRIAENYPVLSLGVSVEKGTEVADGTGSGPVMQDRSKWDWHRITTSSREILSSDLPRVAAGVQRLLAIRFSVHHRGELSEQHSKVYSLIDGEWFERYTGTTSVNEIAEHIDALDKLEGHWADAYFAVDLAPDEADGMTPSQIAQLLLAFEPVRRRLRGRS